MRFIVFHIHPVSARLRLLLRGERLCLPEPLPVLSVLAEHHDDATPLTHPGVGLTRLQNMLSLQTSTLTKLPGFRVAIEVPNATLSVFAAQVTSEEPFAAPLGFRWIEFMENYDLRDVERLLLRRLYDHLLS